MYIDFIREYQLTQRLIHMFPKVEPITTAVFCVSPDYSSGVAMQVAHHLSDRGNMPDLHMVEVPYPKESIDQYIEELDILLDSIVGRYDKIVLVEAAVLSGNNYTWIVDMICSRGFEREDIIATALIQKADSIFECDLVGDYVTDMPEFYWERYNKHWD
jgi:hypothetical protein